MDNIIVESYKDYIIYNNIKYCGLDKYIKFDWIVNNNKRVIIHNLYQNYKGNVINKKRYGFVLKKKLNKIDSNNNKKLYDFRYNKNNNRKF